MDFLFVQFNWNGGGQRGFFRHARVLVIYTCVENGVCIFFLVLCTYIICIRINIGIRRGRFDRVLIIWRTYMENRCNTSIMDIFMERISYVPVTMNVTKVTSSYCLDTTFWMIMLAQRLHYWSVIFSKVEIIHIYFIQMSYNKWITHLK